MSDQTEREAQQCAGPGAQEYEGPQFGRQWIPCPSCGSDECEGRADE